MADPRPYPAPGDTGLPRCVKVFGIIAVVGALLVIGLMIVGGGSHGPDRHAPPAGAGDSAPSSIRPEDTGGGGPADASEGARTVEVCALDTMTFEPAWIEVTAGETVTFVVTNNGQAVHEFTLGDAAMQQEYATQMEHLPDGVAHDQPNSITLQPGETGLLTCGSET
nr:hypothetical protein [Chloroflexota bacterium]